LIEARASGRRPSTPSARAVSHAAMVSGEAATHAVIGVAILVLLAMVAPVKPKARRI